MSAPINPYSAKEIVLSFGCGLKKPADAIGLDKRALPGVDIVADGFRASLPFRSGVFSRVECIHVLEHAENLTDVMEEIYRVLKPGGVLHLIAPHGATLRFWGDPTHKTAITCSTFNYFLPGYDYNFYSKARFTVEQITLDRGDNAKKSTTHRIVNWLWKKRMWQMEKILTFFRVDFALDVMLKKVDNIASKG